MKILAEFSVCSEFLAKWKTTLKLRHFSCYFSYKCFHHRRSLSDFKNSCRTYRKNLWWSEFSVQLQVVDWAARIALNKLCHRSFSGNFPKLLKQYFFRIFPGKYKLFFQKRFDFCYFIKMTLLQAFSWKIFKYFRILTENIFLGGCFC